MSRIVAICVTVERPTLERAVSSARREFGSDVSVLVDSLGARSGVLDRQRAQLLYRYRTETVFARDPTITHVTWFGDDDSYLPGAGDYLRRTILPGHLGIQRLIGSRGRAPGPAKRERPGDASGVYPRGCDFGALYEDDRDWQVMQRLIALYGAYDALVWCEEPTYRVRG